MKDPIFWRRRYWEKRLDSVGDYQVYVTVWYGNIQGSRFVNYAVNVSKEIFDLSMKYVKANCLTFDLRPYFKDTLTRIIDFKIHTLEDLEYVMELIESEKNELIDELSNTDLFKELPYLSDIISKIIEPMDKEWLRESFERLKKRDSYLYLSNEGLYNYR